MSDRITVLMDIDAERNRQDEKWGPQTHPSGTGSSFWAAQEETAKAVCEVRAERGTITWKDILYEEVAEAFAEGDEARLRAELVQVAAVAAAWAEDIDRRG